jgi:hypothetical protein
MYESRCCVACADELEADLKAECGKLGTIEKVCVPSTCAQYELATCSGRVRIPPASCDCVRRWHRIWAQPLAECGKLWTIEKVHGVEEAGLTLWLAASLYSDYLGLRCGLLTGPRLASSLYVFLTP